MHGFPPQVMVEAAATRRCSTAASADGKQCQPMTYRFTSAQIPTSALAGERGYVACPVVLKQLNISHQQKTNENSTRHW